MKLLLTKLPTRKSPLEADRFSLATEQSHVKTNWHNIQFCIMLSVTLEHFIYLVSICQNCQAHTRNTLVKPEIYRSWAIFNAIFSRSLSTQWENHTVMKKQKLISSYLLAHIQDTLTTVRIDLSWKCQIKEYLLSIKAYCTSVLLIYMHTLLEHSNTHRWG